MMLLFNIQLNFNLRRGNCREVVEKLKINFENLFEFLDLLTF